MAICIHGFLMLTGCHFPGPATHNLAEPFGDLLVCRKKKEDHSCHGRRFLGNPLVDYQTLCFLVATTYNQDQPRRVFVRKTWNKAHGDNSHCSGVLEYFKFKVPFISRFRKFQPPNSFQWSSFDSSAWCIQRPFPDVPMMFAY